MERKAHFFLLIVVFVVALLFFVGCGSQNTNPTTTSTTTSTSTTTTSATTTTTTTTSTTTTSTSSTTTSTTTTTTTTTTTYAPPVLKNLIVSIEVWDQATNLAGSIFFKASREKVFLEFGATKEANNAQGYSYLPTFEYYTTPEAVVFSPIDGVITTMTYQADTDDYEMSIVPELGSDWIIFIDHVKDLQVSSGETLVAGQVLGTAGNFDATLGRTELQVRAFNTDWAPFRYFDPNLTTEYQNKIWALMASWETFKGDPDLYDEAVMLNHYAGCLFEYISDEAASP